MIYRDLFRSHSRISKLGLGTVNFGCDYAETKEKNQGEVDSLLNRCQELGINYLDTASDYGTSEEKIGDYLSRHSKNDFLIATKIRHIDETTAQSKQKLYNHLSKSLAESLERLKVQKISVLQSHQADKPLMENSLFWETLSDLKEQGLFEMFGVSIYDSEEAGYLASEHSDLVDFIQLPYSIFDQRLGDLFSLFHEKNINVISRSVFLRGMIPASEDLMPTELKELKPYRNKLSILSKKLGLTSAETALIYAVGNSSIHSTIVGVDSIEQLNENHAVLSKMNLFERIKEECAELGVWDSALIDPRKRATL